MAAPDNHTVLFGNERVRRAYAYLAQADFSRSHSLLAERAVHSDLERSRPARLSWQRDAGHPPCLRSTHAQYARVARTAAAAFGGKRRPRGDQ